jgi:hypothetical protein
VGWEGEGLWGLWAVLELALRSRPELRWASGRLAVCTMHVIRSTPYTCSSLVCGGGLGGLGRGRSVGSLGVVGLVIFWGMDLFRFRPELRWASGRLAVCTMHVIRSTPYTCSRGYMYVLGIYRRILDA